MWKLFWDILATATGAYIGFKVFLFTGDTIPLFGYFPIGVIAGMSVLWLVALAVHGVEGTILWVFSKSIRKLT